ncbi:hypothetical protein F4560_001085 [Saccharothrix ecbatanensis]|uniref:Uncharacterized protein n=1 Tax=Saccharothrix ecbatanensis TaxID=1105145 RepID=A0A7W9HFI1_9PSEU|nr:hypothetical protein [Saccharothrix ecbatanensis]
MDVAVESGDGPGHVEQSVVVVPREAGPESG